MDGRIVSCRSQPQEDYFYTTHERAISPREALSKATRIGGGGGKEADQEEKVSKQTRSNERITFNTDHNPKAH